MSVISKFDSVTPWAVGDIIPATDLTATYLNGWMKLDGSIANKSTYPALASMLGTIVDSPTFNTAYQYLVNGAATSTDIRVRYGNGIYVLNAGYDVFTSTNIANVTLANTAGTGTTVTTPFTGALRAYGRGIYVHYTSSSIQYNSIVYYSTNLVNWSTNNANGSNTYHVYYGGGRFVSVGTANVIGAPYAAISSSTNFVNWTDASYSSVVLNASSGVVTGAYGKGIWITAGNNNQGVGTTTSRIFTSTNSLNWTVTNPTIRDNWITSTYGNGIFFVASPSSAVVATTTNFTQTNVPSMTIAQVTYAAGRFILAGTDTVYSQSVIYTSTNNGANWAQVSYQDIGSDTSFTDISMTYGAGYIIKTVGSYAFTSTNAVNWSRFKRVPGASVIYGNGIFVTKQSTDTFGYAFTATNLLGATDRTGIGTIYGNGLYVCQDQNIFNSTNAVNWTLQTQTTGLASSDTVISEYLNGRYIIVSSSSVLSSTNGVNWATTTKPTAVPAAINFGNGYYVVGCEGRTVQSSTDLSSWTSRTVSQIGATITVGSVAYLNGRFILGHTSTNAGGAYIYYPEINFVQGSSATKGNSPDIISTGYDLIAIDSTNGELSIGKFNDKVANRLEWYSDYRGATTAYTSTNISSLVYAGGPVGAVLVNYYNATLATSPIYAYDPSTQFTTPTSTAVMYIKAN